jgi:hypothetical protein
MFDPEHSEGTHMKKFACGMLVLGALLSGCVAYDTYDTPRYSDSPSRGYDRDRDGVVNSRDRDRDGDGVPNRADRYPNNPRWY